MKITKLGLGCWAFGGDWYWGRQSHNDSVKTIQAALRGGIKHFDTARSYSNGRSEQITGQQLKRDRENVIIATKTTWLPADSVEKMIDISLKRLCTDWIDILYIHWPVGSVPIKKMMEEMKALKEKGKIKAIGVSNFNIKQLKEASSYTQVDTLQPPYNLYWRFPEDELIPFCIENSHLNSFTLGGIFQPPKLLFRPRQLYHRVHRVLQADAFLGINK